jgi:thiol-disulfide isomerase/thioredoxin
MQQLRSSLTGVALGLLLTLPGCGGPTSPANSTPVTSAPATQPTADGPDTASVTKSDDPAITPPSTTDTETADTETPSPNTSNAPTTTDPANPAVATEETTEAPAAGIDLKEMSWDQLQELVAAKSGKVVVVDIWSTSCEPCLREFPHLVALQKRFPDDVVCISFDCDYIGARNKPLAYYRERVLKNLASQKAEGLINVICTTAADELFTQIDVDSIPAVYVYDRAGKLAKRFDNRTPAGGTEEGISYETQIDPLVAELVKAE